MPFIIMVIAIIVAVVIRSSVAKSAQQAQQQKRAPGAPGAPEQRPSMQQTAGRPQVFNVPQPPNGSRTYNDGEVVTRPVAKPVPVEKSREQLAEEARQLMEAMTGRRTTAPASNNTARQQSARSAETGRPVIQHGDDDCGGGSIHDGYHEGVSGVPFGEKKPRAAVAGNLGKKLAAEDDAAVKAKHEAENAKRALARISKLPPMAQGIIYSEILGKPKSEIA